MSNFVVKSIGNTLNAASYLSKDYATKKAFNLFATPRKGRLSEKDKKYLNSAKQTTLQHDNLDIATYNWQGQGKTILLLHGWESNSARWQYLIPKLQELNFNIVTIDGPAHGASGGTEFNALLYSNFVNETAKHFNPEIIIGHSVGGMATVFFQSRFQSKTVEKLITLGSPSSFEAVMANYVKMLGYNNRIKTGLDQYILKHFGNLPSHFNAGKFSSSITSKGLTIHDTEDKIIPYKDALEYQSHFKNTTLVTTTGYGHGLKSDEVTQHILNFITN